MAVQAPIDVDAEQIKSVRIRTIGYRIIEIYLVIYLSIHFTYYEICYFYFTVSRFFDVIQQTLGNLFH